MKLLSYLFVLSFLFVLGACSQMEDSAPVSPQDEITLSKVPVPFKATFEGLALISIPPTSECGSQLPLSTLTGSGVGTHLGNYTSDSYACLVPDGTITGKGIFINGYHTVIAANGDELYATWSGEYETDLTTGMVAYTYTFLFTGGTGRFVGVTGEVEGSATAPYGGPGEPKAITAEMFGWILFE
ncbi:MAG: hypothetical protein R6W68_15535 [Ignavibacteriaceae bacterium]